ncbi:hypothetical protein D3C87_1706720 [compost metagenome]
MRDANADVVACTCFYQCTFKRHVPGSTCLHQQVLLRKKALQRKFGIRQWVTLAKGADIVL